jgi:hypothetical protein
VLVLPLENLNVFYELLKEKVEKFCTKIPLKNAMKEL